jgi:hypothetical protein
MFLFLQKNSGLSVRYVKDKKLFLGIKSGAEGTEIELFWT